MLQRQYLRATAACRTLFVSERSCQVIVFESERGKYVCSWCQLSAIFPVPSLAHLQLPLFQCWSVPCALFLPSILPQPWQFWKFQSQYCLFVPLYFVTVSLCHY
jgi:hypothetical protein